MNLTDLGRVVAKYAPLLGSVLPIPGGLAIGTAIAKAFGGDANNTDDLIRRINADPEAAVKLKQIESNERIQIEAIAVDRIRAGNEDRASARNRENTVRDKIPGQIAMVFTSGYLLLAFSVIAIVFFGVLDPSEKDTLAAIIKEMSMAEMLVLAYYFGASNPR